MRPRIIRISSNFIQRFLDSPIPFVKLFIAVIAQSYTKKTQRRHREDTEKTQRFLPCYSIQTALLQGIQ